MLRPGQMVNTKTSVVKGIISLGLLAALFLGLSLSPVRGDHMPEPDLCHRDTWADLDAEDLTRAITYLGDVNRTICGFRESVLFMAAQFGDVDHINQLLEAGSDPDIIAFDGCPPICRAMLWNTPDVAARLLDDGIDLDVKQEIEGHFIDRMLFFAPQETLTVLFSEKYRSRVLPLLTQRSWTAAIHRPDSTAIRILLNYTTPPETVEVYVTDRPSLTIPLLIYAVGNSPSTETIALLIPYYKWVKTDDNIYWDVPLDRLNEIRTDYSHTFRVAIKKNIDDGFEPSSIAVFPNNDSTLIPPVFQRYYLKDKDFILQSYYALLPAPLDEDSDLYQQLSWTLDYWSPTPKEE